MRLSYKRITFNVAFAEKAVFPFPPPFLFRSLIGSQLRRMCCIARSHTCGDCPYNQTCVYGSVFESVVPKDNPALPGRDRIAHPVILESPAFLPGAWETLPLTLILLGPAVRYAPYFFAALKNAGVAGVLKARIPFAVTDVADEAGASLLAGPETLDTRFTPDLWEYDPQEQPSPTEPTGPTGPIERIQVHITSPLRFRTGGHYSDRFSAEEFTRCLHRRAMTLCAQYGEGAPDGAGALPVTWAITDRALTWRDFTHYSARQRRVMRLGGVMGRFTITGSCTRYDLALFRFAERFHAGKNTNFGLGAIRLAPPAPDGAGYQ